MVWASMLAAGAAALTGHIINAVSSRRQQRSQNAYNKQMADLQNQKELDYWKMQNEYNTPAAQMARLKAAGLNPNLAYQNVTTGNSDAMPTFTTPENSFASYAGDAMQNIGNTLASQVTAYQAIQMNAEQIRQQEMQNRMLEAHMSYADRAAFLKYHGQELQTVLSQSQIDKVNQEITNLQESKELTHQQRLNLEKNLDLLGKQLTNMDVQNRIALIDEAIKGAQRDIINDTNNYAREFMRIEGRLIKSESLSDIGLGDVLKYVIFGLLNGHLNIPTFQSK